MNINVDNTNKYNSKGGETYEYSQKMGKSKKGESIEDVFRRFDAFIEQVHEEDKEYFEKLDKYRKEQEKLKKEQKQRLANKQALMEKTGTLWTSGLTDESKQILMRKAPGLMAKYEMNKKLKEKQEKDKLSELV